MMASWNRKLLLVMAALSPMSVRATSAQPSTSSRGEPLVLSSTFEHRIASRIIPGREFLLWVSLPPSYRDDSAGDSTRFPVLYLLDGRQSLQLLEPMLRLTNRGRSGNVILVGIGYPLDTRGMPSCGRVLCCDIDYMPPAFRTTDSITTTDARAADRFLRVLKDEIIPFVERRYRTTEDRGLFGYSQGGLFVTYALFEVPNLFTRYAAVSPSIYQDVDGMLRRELAFRAQTPRLPKTVYISVGSEEAPYSIADTWRMIGALCDGQFSGKSYGDLKLLTAIQTGADHRSPALHAGAIQALYPADTSAPVRWPTRLMSDACIRR